MDQVPESFQNGHTSVYKEVNDDGTVTEYQEEQYLVEADSQPTLLGNDITSQVVVLQDDDDIQVYQQHEVLSDGREMITTTTTTVTLNEEGETVEETVTEIVQSEEVEVEEDAEGEVEEPVSAREILESDDADVRSTSLAGDEKRDEEEDEERDEEEDEEEDEEGCKVESSTSVEYNEADPVAEVPLSTSDVARDANSDCELVAEDQELEPVKTISRRISYEEFAEQYTEYKPPKRYEKKQTTTTAEKAAPKIRIMGLPNNDYYSASTGSSVEAAISPRTSSHVEDIAEEEMSISAQPTRTQGSVMRRMDQNAIVDPANVVRAEDTPDLEAELPSRGTSQSLKNKFQAMDGGQPQTVDFSQPIKREKPRTIQNRHSVGVTVTADSPNSESSHRIPEFEGGEIENNPEVRHDVAREADRNEQEELPEIGQAKNLLSKWSQREVSLRTRKEHTPSGVGSKPTVTPLRPTSRVVEEDNTNGHNEPEVEGGEYENTPVERSDVVKESDGVDIGEELPTVGFARSIMSQFKQKEQEAKKVPVFQPSGAGNRAPRVTAAPSSVPSAEPHVEPQFEGGAVENVPVVRPDVVRESDRSDEQELPEVGYAKNLKARLRELEKRQTPADYVEHKPSGIANKATPTPIRISSTNNLSTSINSLSSSTDEVESRIEPQLEGGEYENQPIKRTDVIREDDIAGTEELPEAGLAKNLMSRFRMLESEKPPSYKPSGVGSKATPSKLHIMAGKSSYSAKGIVPEPIVSTPGDDDMPAVEAGEYENTPQIRDDVIRADTRNEDNELPEQGVTKNIMSRFRSMEAEKSTTVQHRPSKVASKPTPTPLRPTSAVDINNTVSETLSTDRLEAERSDHESPEVSYNVIRASDSNEHDHVPSAGAAKNIMDKFRQLETKKSDHIEHRPSKVASSLTPTPLQLKR